MKTFKITINTVTGTTNFTVPAAVAANIKREVCEGKAVVLTGDKEIIIHPPQTIVSVSILQMGR